ncbi:hypothetical protein [Paenibacillus sp. L3-i20]|uniref:hypothetical protein n=1 Tax=Paenibacillus sp. L3-i20 TaxID=2905833 RepID=UPI001EDF4C38|nr:hypothetical protein [Paenibacillus sp. L3-i20]
MLQEFRCSDCNKLLAKIQGRAEIVCTRCKLINTVGPKSDKELSELTSYLPISSEDALDFVNGCMNGYLMNNPINHVIALSSRDRLIAQLKEQVDLLRKIK